MRTGRSIPARSAAEDSPAPDWLLPSRNVPIFRLVAIAIELPLGKFIVSGLSFSKEPILYVVAVLPAATFV